MNGIFMVSKSSAIKKKIFYQLAYAKNSSNSIDLDYEDIEEATRIVNELTNHKIFDMVLKQELDI